MAKTYAQEKNLLKDNLKGAQHLGIPVADIDKAKDWYSRILGFAVVHEPNVPTDQGVIKVAFLKKDNITLELYQLVGKNLEEVKTRAHGHIDHFAIDVADINKALQNAVKAGAKLEQSTADGIQSIPSFWSKGVKYVILQGPAGEKVEFNQRFDLPATAQNLRGWSHLGIPATDINNSKNFYRRFGFKEVMYAEILQQAGTIKASMMQKDDFTIELYQLYGDALDEVAKRKDGRIDHIAFDVADIDKAFSELKNAGLLILEDAPLSLNFWDKGIKYFNIRGPNSEKLEFSQVLR
jgi:lactoylglutathione lyase